MIKLLIFLSLILLNFNSLADDFTYNIAKWKEFAFGQDFLITKKLLEKRCNSIDDYDDTYINGYRCGKWLGLDIDIRVMSDEGGFFGGGKKLIFLEIKTNYSPEKRNVILKFLNNEFKLMRDYDCWEKENDFHACSIIYNNGAVIFQDRKWSPKRRYLGIQLWPEEAYKPDAFKKK